MSFEDLVKHFYSINVCMVRHKDYHPKPWIVHRSRFHYDYDADELTPDAHRECINPGCTVGFICTVILFIWVKLLVCLFACLIQYSIHIHYYVVCTQRHAVINPLSPSLYHIIGINVPMYVLTVHKTGDFIAEVHQQDVRCQGAKEYMDLGVSILQATETFGMCAIYALLL